jgi:ankyrin repeat protein
MLQAIAAAKPDWNAIATNGGTPLLLAVEQNCLPAVRLLVEAGADLSVKNQRGATALEYARRRRLKEIVEFLESKAKP